MDELFFLKWNDYNSEMIKAFQKLRKNNQLIDVTLTCENRVVNKKNNFKKFRQFKAHKILLCVCSPYLREILLENPSDHPVIMLREIQAEELEAILAFIYAGEVQVQQESLELFIKAAKFLQIRGLVPLDEENEEEGQVEDNEEEHYMPEDDYQVDDYYNDYTDQRKSSSSAARNRSARQKRKYDPNVPFVDDEDDEDFNVRNYSSKKRRPAPARKSRPQLKNESLDGEGGQNGEPGNYPCDKCDRVYTCHSSLRVHQDVHKGRTTCQICNRVLSRVNELRRHYINVHKRIPDGFNENGLRVDNKEVDKTVESDPFFDDVEEPPAEPTITVPPPDMPTVETEATA